MDSLPLIFNGVIIFAGRSRLNPRRSWGKRGAGGAPVPDGPGPREARRIDAGFVYGRHAGKGRRGSRAAPEGAETACVPRPGMTARPDPGTMQA